MTTTPVVLVNAPLPDSTTVGPLSRCMLNFHVMPEFAQALMQLVSDSVSQFIALTRDVGSDGVPYINSDGTVTVFHYDEITAADAKAILKGIQPLVSHSEHNTFVYRKFGINLKSAEALSAALRATGS